MLELASSTAEDLRRMAVRSHPTEACGVLVGHEKDGVRRILNAVSCPNLNTERARDRYTLDPQAFLAADTEARAAGLEILGIWHTHPDHPAEPSDTDRQAAWPGWSYLILSVTQDGVTDWRSWRLADTAFQAEPLVRLEVPA